MKKLTIRQMRAVKNIAENVNPLVTKKNRLLAKIDEMVAEIESLDMQIEGHEGGVKALTGGYTSEKLVKKVVEDTGKVDKNGKPIKETKYLPTDIVTYNEEDKCYYINEPENVQTVEEVVTSVEEAVAEVETDNIVNL